MSLATDLLTALGIDTHFMLDATIRIDRPNELRVEATYIVDLKKTDLGELQKKTKNFIVTETEELTPDAPAP